MEIVLYEWILAVNKNEAYPYMEQVELVTNLRCTSHEVLRKNFSKTGSMQFT